MQAPLPLYILAGGQSRRFGTDKARACINGQPLVQRIADHLLPGAKGVCVVADRADKYADLGLATLADPFPHRGPLNGLVTALTHQLTQRGRGWLILAPCDLTDPSPAWVRPLIEATDLCAAGTAAAYIDSSQRWHPLPCLVHTDVCGLGREALRRDRLSMWRFLDEINAQRVVLPTGYDAVPSANTPAELMREWSNPQAQTSF